MRRLNWKFNTLIFFALGTVALSTLYPLIYVAMTSSRTLEDYVKNAYGLPKFFTFESYRILINNYSLGTAARNTILVVGVSLTACLILSSIAGFALAKYEFPGSKAVSWSFIAVMLLPSQILIIPIYLLLSKFGLVGHLYGLMFVYIGTNIPFAVCPNHIEGRDMIKSTGFSEILPRLRLIHLQTRQIRCATDF